MRRIAHTVDSWRKAPASVALRADHVDVWRLDLRVQGGRLAALSGLLSVDELLRASSFVFASHRERFVASRGLLRYILGRYLDVDPHSISFYYGANGKPALGTADDDDQIRFNMSHSGDRALVAVSMDRNVGVDIERIRTDLGMHRLARRFFTPAERAALAGVDPNVRQTAFFTIWTRKEAFLKATGEGMSLPLDQVQPPDAWTVRDLRPAVGYVGALATQGEEWELRCWKWNE